MSRTFLTPVVLPADPTSAMQAVTKQYVDNGYQPLDSDLTAIGGLTPTNGDMIRRESGVWVARSMAQIKTALALTSSDVGLGNVDNTSDASKRHVGITVAGASQVTTTSTSYVTLGSSDLAVTLPYPPSGVATIMLRAAIGGSQVALNAFGYMSFEIRDTNTGGTQRLAASDDRAIYSLSKTANEVLAATCMFHTATGLPTSGTMYVRAMYHSSSGSNTAAFAFRALSVLPSP